MTQPKNIRDRFAFNIIKEVITARTHGYTKSANYEEAGNIFWDSLVEDGVMHIGKTKIPDIRWFGGWFPWPYVYADTMLIHHFFNDEYTLENMKMVEGLGCEGPYCVDEVVVNKDDVVIDAGGYIGDWAAVAAAMGGKVYCFDPSPSYLPIIEATAKMNGFTFVNKGLGEKSESKKLALVGPAGDKVSDEGTVNCSITSVDDFAQENALEIDFIKSDIEGFERYMLKGAARTLVRDEPKLAIRTYHFPEDRELLTKIIKDTNPKYKIFYGHMTLYAFVP